MFRAEAVFCSGKDFEEIIASEEKALFKTIAELSCLTYQLTKIPFIKGEGRGGLKELLGEITISDEQELEEIVVLRAGLFDKAQAARGSFQTIDWVWEKVAEEVAELQEESQGYEGGLKQGLEQGIEKIKVQAGSDEPDLEALLGSVFDLARFLGVKNELNLFRFMAEKQEARIGMGRAFLTAQDKALEWQRLLPLAQKYFN